MNNDEKIFVFRDGKYLIGAFSSRGHAKNFISADATAHKQSNYTAFESNGSAVGSTVEAFHSYVGNVATIDKHDIMCSEKISGGNIFKLDGSTNNGGKTDYYQLDSSPFPINDADDFAEWRGMNFFQGNILKVVWTFNTGRHSGTDQIRDLNKIIHYANREKERIEREDNLQ